MRGVYKDEDFVSDSGFKLTEVDGNRYFSFLLGIFVLDSHVIQLDLFYTQMLINLMFFMFAVSRNYYLKKNKRINPISDKMMD